MGSNGDTSPSRVVCCLRLALWMKLTDQYAGRTSGTVARGISSPSWDKTLTLGQLRRLRAPSYSGISELPTEPRASRFTIGEGIWCSPQLVAVDRQVRGAGHVEKH